MVYTNNHKIILQILMNEGFLNENKAKEFVIKLFSK